MKLFSHDGNVLVEMVGAVLYVLLMVIYIPQYLLMSTILYIKLGVSTLVLLTGVGVIKRSSVSAISEKYTVSDVSSVETSEEVDFLWHRSPAYVRVMSFIVPKEVVKFLLKQHRIEEVTDQQLVYQLLHSVYSHALTWDKERQLYILDMSYYDLVHIYNGNYWDIRKVEFSRDAKTIHITAKSSSVYSSTGDPDMYRLAKLHLRVCMTYFAPAMAHNYVHFVLPPAISISAKKVLEHDSVLYKVLAPHFRFTERINYQALRVGAASDNRNTWFHRFYCVWKSFPVPGEVFVDGVAHHCHKHYTKEKECNESESFCHPLFPPEYVNDTEKQKIPYLYMLCQYYRTVETFIKKIEHLISEEEWRNFSSAVSEYVKDFDKIDKVTAITTFINQVSVLHSCDHATFTSFTERFGSMYIKYPFTDYEDKKTWQEIARSKGCDLDVIKQDPTALISQEALMKTRCFIDVFGHFLPTSNCDIDLTSTDYEFIEPEAVEAQNEFLRNLTDIDQKLKSENSVSKLDCVGRCSGNRILPLKEFIRCVSY